MPSLIAESNPPTTRKVTFKTRKSSANEEQMTAILNNVAAGIKQTNEKTGIEVIGISNAAKSKQKQKLGIQFN